MRAGNCSITAVRPPIGGQARACLPDHHHGPRPDNMPWAGTYHPRDRRAAGPLVAGRTAETVTYGLLLACRSRGAATGLCPPRSGAVSAKGAS